MHWRDSWREEINRERKLRGGVAVTEGAKGKQGNPGQPFESSTSRCSNLIPLQVSKGKQSRVEISQSYVNGCKTKQSKRKKTWCNHLVRQIILMTCSQVLLGHGAAQLSWIERHSKQHSRFWTFGAKIEKMRQRRPGSGEQRNSTMLAKSRKWTWQRIRGNDSANNRMTVRPFSITALWVAGVVDFIPAIWGPRRGRPSTSCQFMAIQRDKQLIALTTTDNSELPISLMFNISRGSWRTHADTGKGSSSLKGPLVGIELATLCLAIALPVNKTGCQK